jgi:hypothetical protein
MEEIIGHIKDPQPAAICDLRWQQLGILETPNPPAGPEIAQRQFILWRFAEFLDAHAIDKVNSA